MRRFFKIVTGLLILATNAFGQSVDFSGYCESKSLNVNHTFNVFFSSVYGSNANPNVPTSISSEFNDGQENFQNLYNNIYEYRPGERVYFSLENDGEYYFEAGYLETFDYIIQVYADWNGDGVIEDSEICSPSEQSFNWGVLPPVDAIRDEPILMRFVLQETQTYDDIHACGTYDFGQTKNFVIKIREENSFILPNNNAISAAIDELDTAFTVWTNELNDLKGRFFSVSQGEWIGDEFLIDDNSYTPTVIYNTFNDNFVIVWNKDSVSIEMAFIDKGLPNSIVQNQIFNSNNSANFNDVCSPSICEITDGSQFMIVWVSDSKILSSPNFSSEIWGQKINTNGTTVFANPENLTAQESANENPIRQNPRVAYSNIENKFILTWENYVEEFKKIKIYSEVFLNNSELEFQGSNESNQDTPNLDQNTISHNSYSSLVSFNSPDVTFNKTTGRFLNIWNYQVLNIEQYEIPFGLTYHESNFYGKNLEISGSNTIQTYGSLINFSNENLDTYFDSNVVGQRALSSMELIESRNEFLIANVIGPIPEEMLNSFNYTGTPNLKADSLILYRINGNSSETDDALVERKSIGNNTGLPITNSLEDGIQLIKPAIVYNETQRVGVVFYLRKNNNELFIDRKFFSIDLDDPPFIASTDEDSIQAGGSFTITGTNFSETVALNIVKLGTTELTVNTATTSTLNVTVPANMTRGSYTLTVEYDGQTGTFGQNIFIKAVPAFTDFSPKTVFNTQSVTVTGSGFSNNNADNEILLTSVNDSQVTYLGEITSSSSGSVTFDLPGGIPRGNYYIKASVDGLGVQHAQSLKVKVLHDITSITPTTGLANDIITLTGSNFSTNLNTFPVTATVGGLTANVISSTSENINIRIPQNLPRGITDIVITIDGESVSEIGALTILVPPDPGALDPDSAYANDIISIVGQNFRSSLSGNTIQVGNIIVTQPNVISAATSEIEFRVPDGLTRGYKIVSVTTDGQKVDVPQQLKYKVRPEITGLSATREEPFNTIVINGENFSTNENYINKVFFGNLEASIQDSSSTALTVVVPDLTSRDDVKVKVVIDGDTATATDMFSAILGSTVTGIVPDSAYAGDLVTIDGMDFLETNGGNLVEVGSLDISNFEAISGNALSFTMPAGLTRGYYDVFVTTDGIKGNTPEQIKFKVLPSISSLSAEQQEPFTSLTITGENFSDNSNFPNQVFFGDLEATIEEALPTSLTVTIPGLINRDLVDVIVIIDGDTATAPVQFRAVLGSGIYNIIPDVGYRNDTITVHGKDFDEINGNEVYIKDVLISNILNETDSTITFIIPNDFDLNRGLQQVKVISDGKESISPVDFKFKIKPQIDGIIPLRAFAGTSLEISGDNFSLDGNFPNAVFFGDIPAAISNQNKSILNVIVPNIPSRGGLPVKVAIDGDTVVSPNLFEVYIQPELVSFSPGTGEPGDTVTINGNYFEDQINQNILKIGGINTSIVEANSTTLKALVPANSQRGNAAITIVVDELTDSLSIEENPFIIQIRPVVTGLTDNIGHTSEVIEITGEKFSIKPNFPNEVFLGDLKLSLDQSLATQNSIKFTVPNDLAGAFPVRVVIDGMEAENSPMLTIHLGGEMKSTIPSGPLSTFDINQGSATIGFEVYDQDLVLNPQVFGKGFSDEVFEPLSKNFAINQNQLTVTLSANDIQDELGYSYYFQWQHDHDQLPDSTFKTEVVNMVLGYPGNHSEAAITGINFVSGSGAGTGEDYQMMSFPFDISSNNPKEVLKHDNANGYDDRYFRLYKWNKESQDYDEFNNGNFTFTLGDAYFLIARDGTSFQYESANTWNLEENGVFEMEIQNGWNLIATPYPFDLDWNTILDENGNPTSLENLIVYKNGGFTNSNKLEKFRGGFIKNTGPDINLIIPVTAKSNGRKAISKNLPDNWQMKIDLSSAKISNKTSGFGVNPESYEGLDNQDQHRVPRFLEYVDIEFQDPSFYDEKISTSIIGQDQYYTWEFVVNSSDKGGIHRMRWEDFEFLERSLQIMLYDVEHEKVIDMKGNDNYSFTLKDQHRFKIFYGDQQYLDENLIPENSLLGEPYPNPFSNETILPFTLDKKYEEAEVDLNVYDLNGREIYHYKYPYLEPGFHSFKWDGRDISGTIVGDGVYILQLKIQNSEYQLIDSKMVIKN